MQEPNLWSMRTWIGPSALPDVGELPRKPGLYCLVATRRSRPAKIRRFLDADPSGVLYLGKAARLRGRVLTLAQCILEKKRGHAAGVSFERIDFLRKSEGLAPISELYGFQIYHSRCATADAADSAETRVIHSYLAQFGEVPPLNSQVSWRQIS